MNAVHVIVWLVVRFKIKLYYIYKHEQPTIENTKQRLAFSCKEIIEQVLNEKEIRIPNRIYIEMVNNKDKYQIKYFIFMSNLM